LPTAGGGASTPPPLCVYPKQLGICRIVGECMRCAVSWGRLYITIYRYISVCTHTHTRTHTHTHRTHMPDVARQVSAVRTPRVFCALRAHESRCRVHVCGVCVCVCWCECVCVCVCASLSLSVRASFRGCLSVVL
jgi:hypothetical protein